MKISQILYFRDCYFAIGSTAVQYAGFMTLYSDVYMYKYSQPSGYTPYKDDPLIQFGARHGTEL